jgi:hypothetical protein
VVADKMAWLQTVARAILESIVKHRDSARGRRKKLT